MFWSRRIAGSCSRPASPERNTLALLARVVAPPGVAGELGRIEVHLAQVAARVASRLVVEVRRVRVAAFATGRDGDRPHARPELDHRDEAVAARAVHPLGARVGARAE